MSNLNYLLQNPLANSGGRNTTGQITIRHRGGGHNKNIRLLNTSLNSGSYNIINTLYNPASSSPLLLLSNSNNNQLTYIPAPLGVDNLSNPFIIMTQFTSILPQNQTTGITLPLHSFPIGSIFHNIEISPGEGGNICSAAGQGAQLLSLTEHWALINLSNNNTLTLPSSVNATLGVTQGDNENLYNAGQNSWNGSRPWVSGEAMNAVDHPQGGRTNGGRIPNTQWGNLANGVPTARNHNSLIA